MKTNQKVPPWFRGGGHHITVMWTKKALPIFDPAHLKITEIFFSFPKYLSGTKKNNKHVKKVGHTSEFLFGIYWWTWKTTIKNCWCGPIKNKIILIITILHLKKNTWRYHYFAPVYQKSPWFMIYSLWQTEIGNFRSIFALLLPYKPKISKLWKHGKNCWRSSSYSCVQKFTIIWCTVLEIRSETEFFVILGHFLPFYPSNDPENQNFEKMKRISGNTIHLHMCSINEDHMMYDSWNIRYKRHNFLSFWTIFCAFTILTTWKIKILKN